MAKQTSKIDAARMLTLMAKDADFLRAVGERLTQTREALRFNQTAAAQAFGVMLVALRRWHQFIVDNGWTDDGHNTDGVGWVTEARNAIAAAEAAGIAPAAPKAPKLTENQLNALRLTPAGVCIRGEWVFIHDGEVITRHVRALERMGLLGIDYYTGGRAGTHQTEAGRALLVNGEA